MATQIPVLDVPLTGAPEPAPVTGPDLVLEGNDGLVLLRGRNPTGGTLTVRVQPPTTVVGFAFQEQDVPLPPGDTWFGALPPMIFNDQYAQVTLSESSGSASFIALRV